MLEVYARLLTFRRAPSALCACLMLMAAVGCKQDWSVPSQSQSTDGVTTDAATPDAATPTGSRDAGLAPRKDAGEPTQPSQPGSGNASGAGGSTSRPDAGGNGPAAGSSGGAADGGTPGSGTPDAGPKPEPCTTAGSMRCQGGGQREICEGGAFRPAEACLADEVCEGNGECVEVAAICQGSAGGNVCDGQGGLISCAANGSVSAQMSCQSERHCQVGVSTGRCPQCIPGEFRCQGASLEQCDDSGQMFASVMTCDSAALCKAESGACTDAACAEGRFSCQGDVLMRCNAQQTGFERVMECEPGLCDARRGTCLACSAGSRSCDSDGSTALVCSSSGEMLSRNRCSAPRSHCVGAGQCVECSVNTPCAASNQACRTSSCNLITGSCEESRVMQGTGCSLQGRSGVCDAAGGCVECLMEGDGRCAGATPHCTTAHTCVRCTENSHCGLGEKCNNGSCIAACGDGVLDPGEDCERGYLSSSASNCDFATCKRLNYLNCRDSSAVCPMGTACLAAFYCMPISDMNCVTSCPEVPGMVSGCRMGVCFLDCSAAAGGQCPSDMTCTTASADGTSNTVEMCFGN